MKVEIAKVDINGYVLEEVEVENIKEGLKVAATKFNIDSNDFSYRTRRNGYF